MQCETLQVRSCLVVNGVEITGGSGGIGLWAINGTWNNPLEGAVIPDPPTELNAVAGTMYVVRAQNDQQMNLRLPESPPAGSSVLIVTFNQGGFPGYSVGVDISGADLIQGQNFLDITPGIADIQRHQFTYDGDATWIHLFWQVGF